MTEYSDNRHASEIPVVALLAKRGIFVTQQRRIIAQALFARDQHLTAEQLYELVNRGPAKVAKATIYNTLSLFSEKGLVREIHVSASKTFYDSNTARHHHFYNVDTGDLIDMKERPIPVRKSRLLSHLISQVLPCTLQFRKHGFS